MPEPGDVVTHYGYDRLPVLLKGVRCFVYEAPAVSGEWHPEFNWVAGEFGEYWYVSRADGGPITKETG